MWSREAIAATIARFLPSAPSDKKQTSTLSERLIRIGRDPDNAPGAFICFISFKFMDEPVFVGTSEADRVDKSIHLQLAPKDGYDLTPIDPDNLCNFTRLEKQDIKACVAYQQTVLQLKIASYLQNEKLDEDQQNTVKGATKLLGDLTTLCQDLKKGQLNTLNPKFFSVEVLRLILNAINLLLEDAKKPTQGEKKLDAILVEKITKLNQRLPQLKTNLAIKIKDLIRDKLTQNLKQQQEAYVHSLEQIYALQRSIEYFNEPIKLDKTFDEMELDDGTRLVQLAEQEQSRNTQIIVLQQKLRAEYETYFLATNHLIDSVNERRIDRRNVRSEILKKDTEAYNKLRSELSLAYHFTLDSSSDEERSGLVPPAAPQPDVVMKENAGQLILHPRVSRFFFHGLVPASISFNVPGITFFALRPALGRNPLIPQPVQQNNEDEPRRIRLMNSIPLD